MMPPPAIFREFPQDLPEDTAGYYRFNKTLHPDMSFNPTLRAVLPVFPKLTAEERHRLLFANVPPSLSLIVRSDMVSYLILHANSHDHSGDVARLAGGARCIRRSSFRGAFWR